MTRTSKTNDKTIGLCSICEKYFPSEDYTLKPVIRGNEPQIVCKKCEDDLKIYAGNQ